MERARVARRSRALLAERPALLPRCALAVLLMLAVLVPAGAGQQGARMAAAAPAVPGRPASTCGNPALTANQHIAGCLTVQHSQIVSPVQVSGAHYPPLTSLPPEHDPVTVNLAQGPYRPVQNPGPASVVLPPTPPLTPTVGVSPTGATGVGPAVSATGVRPHAQAAAPLASVKGPVRVFKNTNLTPIVVDSTNSGWETSEADSGKVVLYSYNYGAAYSADSGKTFHYLDPVALFGQADGGYCCDQVVQYSAQVNRFFWLIQYSANAKNENRYKLAVASPAQITASKGQAGWAVYTFTSATFGQKGAWMDFPDLAVSPATNALYLTFNVIGGAGGAIAALLPLAKLKAAVGFSSYFFVAPNWYLRAAQRPATDAEAKAAYFAQEKDDSDLTIMEWSPGATTIPFAYVPISTISTGGYTSKTPDGTDWFNKSKTSWGIIGATQAGANLWLAWTGGTVDSYGHHPFKQVHIEGAVVNTMCMCLKKQFYLWSKAYAYAHPDLATNSEDEVGIIYVWGGGTKWVNDGVGILTHTRSLWDVTSGKNIGGGGHYMNIRRSFLDGRWFSAAVYVNPKDSSSPYGYTHSTHWIVFGRRSNAPPPAH